MHVGTRWKIQDRRQTKNRYTTETKLSTAQTKKQTTQNTGEQNNRGLVTFYDTRPGNEVDLFYNVQCSWAHTRQ